MNIIIEPFIFIYSKMCQESSYESSEGEKTELALIFSWDIVSSTMTGFIGFYQ